MPRVLITGASGLLGRAILAEFTAQPDWHALGLAFSRAHDKLKRVNLTKEDEVQDVIQDFRPDIVIHAAAERRPDIVEKKEEETKALNVTGTEILCKHAASINASVIYLGTDYVFDGENPPYQIDSVPNPLNKYGASKLDGEKVVQAVSKDNIILRVPILYGSVESLDESAVTVLLTVLMSDTPSKMDDLQDKTLRGVFHWSGNEQMTKYGIIQQMAEIFDLDSKHISPNTEQPTGATKRPHNAQLDSQRLEGLGIGQRTPFKQALEKCLKPYI